MQRLHSHLSRWVWVRLAGPRLDGRLAAGEDPYSDGVLAWRSAQLLSKRARRRIVCGLERVLSARPEREAFSAAVSCDWRAVEIARPALEQLVAVLRSRESVQPQGVALARVLLMEPCSALYRPAHADELYEVAREALFALGTQEAADRMCEGEGQPWRMPDGIRVRAAARDDRRGRAL